MLYLLAASDASDDKILLVVGAVWLVALLLALVTRAFEFKDD